MFPFVHLLDRPTAASIQAGMNVSLSASSLCITRRLYRITAMKFFIATRAEKRREVIIDLLIGLGIPILEIVCSECIQSFTLN